MSLTKLFESFDTKMEALYLAERSSDKSMNGMQSRGKLSPVPSAFMGNPLAKEKIGLEETLDELLKPLKNPLLKWGQSLFLFNQENLPNDFTRQNLNNMAFSPEHVLYVLKKRVEFTFDDYPLLTEEDKDAQKTLVPLLKDFCAKYGLNMINVPST